MSLNKMPKILKNKKEIESKSYKEDKEIKVLIEEERAGSSPAGTIKVFSKEVNGEQYREYAEAYKNKFLGKYI
ncbi:MAG: hypothetical protein QMD65_02040 [Patescibacteria group bacterium]|nr:hypothetical protein [Patescibacteria group bacterium]